MSVAYNKKKKAIRRQLDQENPERKRIRCLIRKGSLPRYRIVSVSGGTKMNSVFLELTGSQYR